MKDLVETERAVLRFRYVDELSQSETARRLGVSQMFVSRMGAEAAGQAERKP